MQGQGSPVITQAWIGTQGGGALHRQIVRNQGSEAAIGHPL